VRANESTEAGESGDSERRNATGRVALVTGASGTIGAAIAQRLVDAGASVVLHGGRDRDRLRDVATRIASCIDPRSGPGRERDDRRVITVLGDVERDADAIVATAINAFGRLDLLVNNAAIQPVAALTEIGTADAAEVLRVNVGGVIAMTKAAIGALRANDANDTTRGVVVNITSIEGLHPPAMHSHYAASKAAVEMHTRAAAFELGPLGIRVVAIAPGLIDHGTLEQAWPEGAARWLKAAPLGRLGTPADVADVVVFAASPAARWITGSTITVDGGVLSNNTW
jgi:NAD(P)-dependent dehydrogenase (short-subunit alcohol dehydrogenase family)